MKYNKISEVMGKLIQKISFLPVFDKTVSKKFLIIAFTALVLVIGIISSVIAVKERKETRAAVTDSTSQESTFVADVNELTGNFLLVLTEDDARDIKLLSVLRLDSENKEITFSFLSPETECYVNGHDGTMQKHLENGGINELLWAVGEYANISIERYIWGDEDNFINLMKDMGEIQIEIDEKISYTHRGISYIIEEGIQKLTADMMLKYFVYLCENKDDKLSSLVETMIIYANEMFASQEDRVEESLGYIVADFTTNLSVVDCSGYKTAIRNMATSLSKAKVTVVDDLSQLK